MTREFIRDELSDRERILLTIIDRLATAQTLLWRAWSTTPRITEYVHFAAWREPEPGELVLAQTGGIGRWKVGFYVRSDPESGGAIIREIGTGLECRYGNESFKPIAGLHPIDLLEGDQRQFYYKVLKAFARADEYVYRFGGIRFESDTCHVTIREVHGGFGQKSVPFTVPVKWGPRTSVKTVLQVLRDGGLGTKSFRPDEPPSGGNV